MSLDNDAIDFLESDDLISWLLMNPDSLNDEIAEFPPSMKLMESSVSSASIPVTEKGRKRDLSRISSSTSMVSSVSERPASRAYSGDGSDDEDDDNASISAPRAESSRKKMMKVAELEKKIKRVTKGNPHLY